MPNESMKPAPPSQPWSRYQQVKRILDKASGETHPSYQGHDRFWNLPLNELLQFKLYGVQMIAPSATSTVAATTVAAPAAAPCCHAPKPTPASGDIATSAASQAGRGASSGLILGLKGSAPFNGAQFPRLPWGGEALWPENIQVIET